ncbi:hypothetical protein [Candidatus Nanohalobium constans]|uniref:Uncharacterized protein n=1 Tax=Candidatus Nanohalobium constans TaxID=2565781 RepID=A0A5Q0UIT8_9ARCH|nr:hypothetical protein [Candidatus Nanohalobium constans]QGA80865.1 hypothetical protein LC1Nh_0985 [Candidatus Nanohalobium constans]
MMIGEENLLRLGILFISLLATNFLTIHLMANFILYKGSSRGKSLRLSAEFASLTTTLILSVLVLYNLLSLSFDITLVYIAALLLGGEGLLVGIVKWWYIHRELDTTWLEAFIISEWFKIAVSILLAVVLALFPNLF